MNPLIPPDNTWALWTVILCGTAAAIWLEQTYRWATKLSGPVLALGMAMVLSNVGVMPTQAPSYDFVGDYLIPLAIPLLVAGNFIMAGTFIVLLSLAGSKWFRRHFRTSHSPTAGKEREPSEPSEHWRRKEISLLDLAKSLAIAFVIVAVSTQLSSAIRNSLAPSFLTSIVGNLFVQITFFSLLVATLLHGAMEKINGAAEMGSYMLYVFLFCIGLPADLWAVVKNVPVLFLFCLIMAVTNLLVTLTLGKLLRIDLEVLLLCVNAALGGAPSAAAMAIAKDWSTLVLPAILMGIWGYVIGTFLGVFVRELLMRWM